MLRAWLGLVSVAVSGCLVVHTEGEPLAEGEAFACHFEIRGEHREVKQCGPFGDHDWVFEHFDFEIDPDTIACHRTGVPCVYEPDHLGWVELHAPTAPR